MSRAFVVFLLSGLGVLWGVSLALMAPHPATPQSIEWLENARSMGPFSLQTEVGEFSNESLMGRWTIVSFGFLHCADICPTNLAQMANVADRFAKDSFDQEVAFVFVSVDPERDSVSEIGQYVRHYASSIRGVTGSAGELSEFAGDLGIQFSVEVGDEYKVAHSITFSIIDPEGAFRGRFRPGFEVADLVSSLTSKIMEARI